MSESRAVESGWPWQVSAALWLFLTDVLELFLAGARLVSANTASDRALDPPGPGGGYLAGADNLLSIAVMGVVIICGMAALGLIAMVWKVRGWTRHLMVLFSAAFLILAGIIGGMPHGLPAYGICFGVVTLTAVGLVYSDASQKWFEQPKPKIGQPVLVGVVDSLQVATPAVLPRTGRPVAVRLAVGCLVGFLVLMFIGWSPDKGENIAPGEADFDYIFDLMMVSTLGLIPYGLWHGVPFARKIATPFCLLSGFLLLFYIWGPDLLNCMMLVLAVGCLVLLHRPGVRAWFDAA